MAHNGRTYEVLVDIPDELRILPAVLERLLRCGRDEREPPLAVVDTKRSVEIEIQAVVEKDDLKVVRRFRVCWRRSYEEIA